VTTPDLPAELRGILADLTGRPELRALPADSPLFDPPVALDSLTGTLLLREIRARYGVDVADEDINLDALATLATLAAFVEPRRGGRAS
jgi:acyl carrier protein